MLDSIRFPKWNAARWIVVGWLALLCMGCRNRAYNEFYVENLNKENRLLEDRVYEYDSEFQALEEENLQLQRTNAALQSKIQELSVRPDSGHSRVRPKASNKPMEIKPEEIKIPQTKPEPPSNPPRSLLNQGTSGKPADEELSSPANTNTNFPPRNPASEELQTDFVLPPGETNRPIQLKDAEKSRLDGRSPVIPAAPIETQVPAGKPTQAVPPLLPKSFPTRSNLKDNSSLNRIPVPAFGKGAVQQASASEPIDGASPTTTNSQPIDQHVLDIAFHPTMCRGHNFDSKPDDDGLYLVITPRNDAGQTINVAGKLTVVVEEQIDAPEAYRVDAWEFGPKELNEYLEPIGVAQGYHLSLPWTKDGPKGNLVTVYLLYVLEDGRKMVSKREIRLRRPTPGQSTWTPR